MQWWSSQGRDADFSISHKISTPQEGKQEILEELCCEIISCFLSQRSSDSVQTHVWDPNRSIVTSVTLSWRRRAGSTAHSPSGRGLRHRSCRRCGRSLPSRSWWHHFQGSATRSGSLHTPAPGASSRRASLTGSELEWKERERERKSYRQFNEP